MAQQTIVAQVGMGLTFYVAVVTDSDTIFSKSTTDAAEAIAWYDEAVSVGAEASPDAKRAYHKFCTARDAAAKGELPWFVIR